MQAEVLVLLLGVSLSGVHGSDDQYTPDVLSMMTKLETRVQTLETSLAQLQNSPHVGFYATLPSTPIWKLWTAPVTTTTLKYKNIVTNVGNGYNSATGIFTAPVRGLYVIHVTAYASGLNPPSGPALKKNAEVLVDLLPLYADDNKDASTRVAVVTLEQGDTVYVELPANVSLLDFEGKSNSFSGFLLSPM